MLTNDDKIDTTNNRIILEKRLISLNQKNKTSEENIWCEWEFVKKIIVNDYLSKDDYVTINNWSTHDYGKKDCEKSEIMKRGEKNHYQFCLCSKYPLTNLMLMQNLLNGERCIIGSCCIKNFGSKNIKTEIRVKLGEAEGKHYCLTCKRKLPDDFPHWKKYHKTCYKKMMGYQD